MISVLILSSTCFGVTYYVDDDAPEGGDGSESNPYKSIQDALDNAISSDEIEVAPGTYETYVSIDFKGKAIRLYSSGSANATIIDGKYSAKHVVQCRSGEGPGTVLEGFTITGGRAIGSWPDNIGGGMFNSNGGSPTVIDCKFIDNHATNGGGMLNREGSPTIIGCTFKNNSVVEQGGGMHNAESSPIVTDCTFVGNTSSHSGGGMGNSDGCSTTVVNCEFSGNSAASQGGGMSVYGSSATITGCTFMGNHADQWGGAITNSGSQTMTLDNCTFTGNSAGENGGALSNWGGNISVCNCILWADVPNEIIGKDPTITFCDVQGEDWPGAGNISINPLFADSDGRLSSSSPCIDAGDNYFVAGTTDLDGNPRVADFPGADDTGPGTPPIVDMGAYEYTWADADTDGDGIEDSVDAVTGVYSDVFDEGSTSGVIVDRAEQVVIITDAPGPSGVRVKASASGGATPAQVSVCGAAVLTLDAGEAVDVTCGSVDVTVVDGTIQIAFVGTYGTELETSLNEGNSIMFEPETSTITVPSTNVDDVVVVVDGQQYTLAPGETESLATPEARLSRLKQFIMDEVTDGNIDPELEVSLLAKADAALSALEKNNPNAAKVAMNDLKALTNHVEAQIDKKITPEVAAEIIEQANAIIEPLGG